MIPLRLLLRAAHWARHPPSGRRVALGLLVLGLCLAVAGLEWVGLLPDWFHLNAPPRRPASGS